MLNTYGLRSINRDTFNQKYHSEYTYPYISRVIVTTALRLHNGTLNILGYIPGVSLYSGSVRIFSGAAMIIGTLCVGDRNARQGAIIQHWYDEAIMMGVAQIARGSLEAFVPFGKVVNAILDVVSTVPNIVSEIEGSLACDECMRGTHVRPHRDADYPFPLSILYLV